MKDRWRLSSFYSDRESLLECVKCLRQPEEVDVTPMGAEAVTVLRRSWTPLGGWKTETRYYPFPEVDLD